VIFVSYSWADSETVLSCVEHLKVMGCGIWIDFERLNLEDALAPQIIDGLRTCDSVLLFDSERARLSPWVSFELAGARNFNRRVIVLPLLSRTTRALHQTATALCALATR
jgi:hypothetical protein